jgi:hypothetical protein
VKAIRDNQRDCVGEADVLQCRRESFLVDGKPVRALTTGVVLTMRNQYPLSPLFRRQHLQRFHARIELPHRKFHDWRSLFESEDSFVQIVDFALDRPGPVHPIRDDTH